MTTWALAGACTSAALMLAGGVSAGGAPAHRPPALVAGDAVDGLPLTEVLRGSDAGYVSFVYGDCEASDDAGCAPPLRCRFGLLAGGTSASTGTRAAARPLSSASRYEAFLQRSSTTARSARAQTGRSTAVVFAGRGIALRVAAALAPRTARSRPAWRSLRPSRARWRGAPC